MNVERKRSGGIPGVQLHTKKPVISLGISELDAFGMQCFTSCSISLLSAILYCYMSILTQSYGRYVRGLCRHTVQCSPAGQTIVEQ